MTETAYTFWPVFASVMVFITLALIILVNTNKSAADIYNSVLKNDIAVKTLNLFNTIRKLINKLRFKDPVNYTILLIRKPYNDNLNDWIIYSGVSIVAFYFILTVF